MEADRPFIRRRLVPRTWLRDGIRFTGMSMAARRTGFSPSRVATMSEFFCRTQSRDITAPAALIAFRCDSGSREDLKHAFQPDGVQQDEAQQNWFSRVGCRYHGLFRFGTVPDTNGEGHELGPSL